MRLQVIYERQEIVFYLPSESGYIGAAQSQIKCLSRS